MGCGRDRCHGLHQGFQLEVTGSLTPTEMEKAADEIDFGERVRWRRDQDFSFGYIMLEIHKAQVEIQVGTWTNKPEDQKRSGLEIKYFFGGVINI